jgi:hypothetical protein
VGSPDSKITVMIIYEIEIKYNIKVFQNRAKAFSF